MDHRERDQISDVVIFEVGEYGTLTVHGQAEPQRNRDVFTGIDPDRLTSAEDLIDAIESVTPLLAKIETLAQDTIDDLEAESCCEQNEPSDCEAMQDQLHRIGSLPGEQWQAWLRSLDKAGLKDARQFVVDWLGMDVDPEDVASFPAGSSPQSSALLYFEQLDSETLDALGVTLIYGDHPGSSYFAAELRVDVDSANRIAVDWGIEARFVREGETAEALSEVVANDPLAARLHDHFDPAFGLPPDNVPGLSSGSRSPGAEPPPALRRPMTPPCWPTSGGGWRR